MKKANPKISRRKFIRNTAGMIALPLLPVLMKPSHASTQTLRMIHNKDFAPFEYLSNHETLGLLPSICDQTFEQIPGYMVRK